MAAPKLQPSQFEIVHVWPHDCHAFTEGLEFFDGVLYESLGGNRDTPDLGLSRLRRVELETGKVLQERCVNPEFFAEGLTIFAGKVFQLTFRSRKVLIYEQRTLKPLGQLPFPGGIAEGWGLTHDSRHLIMSDGTGTIRFLDPVRFSIVRKIEVKDGEDPLTRLNELEYVKNEIYANILGDNRIVRIDPWNGDVLGWIDLTKLRPPNSMVLNGIAHNKANGHLFVTGKNWPSLFEICVK